MVLLMFAAECCAAASLLGARRAAVDQYLPPAWASAHRGKWGQLTHPLEKWMKNQKAKTCKKEQFSMYMLYFESNQGRQV